MEAWEVLERAADLVDDDRFQWPLRCALIAILDAQHPSRAPGQQRNDDSGAMKALSRAIGGDDLCFRVFTWNDAPGRTRDEVSSTMRATAASLKAASTAGTRQHATESVAAQVDGGDAAQMERVQ